MLNRILEFYPGSIPGYGSKFFIFKPLKFKQVMDKFKEVTKNEFYRFIDDHTKEDLVLFSIGEYPYTTHWKTRWGNKLKAKSINFHPKEKAYPVKTKYYISTL